MTNITNQRIRRVLGLSIEISASADFLNEEMELLGLRNEGEIGHSATSIKTGNGSQQV